MKAAKKIRFDSHSVFSKWAKPNIYGSGKLYDLTMEGSKCRHKPTGPSLLTYNPSLSLPLCKIVDEYYQPSYLNYKRHLVSMKDGGKVGVDEVTNTSGTVPSKDYPNILYLPAGGMSSHSPRSKIWSNWFLEEGYPRVFIANKRCTSKVLQYSPQISIPYGKYNDIPDIIDYLVDYLPGQKWIMIGSCFGAQFIMDYFSQSVSENRPEVLGGIVDSFQFDGKKFLQGHYPPKTLLFKKTREFMMHLFIDLTLNKAANSDVYDQVSQLVDRDKIAALDLSLESSVKTVYEEVVFKMCPDAPFNTEEEYFALACPYYDENHKSFLNIKKPLALIYAQDDPFSPFDLDTIEILKENPNLCLWLYAGGGHIVFTEKIFPYTSFIKDVYLENANLLVRKHGML